MISVPVTLSTAKCLFNIHSHLMCAINHEILKIMKQYGK